MLQAGKAVSLSINATKRQALPLYAEMGHLCHQYPTTSTHQLVGPFRCVKGANEETPRRLERGVLKMATKF